MASSPHKKRHYPFKRTLSRKLRRIVFMLVAAAIASAVNYYHNNNDSSDLSSSEYSKERVNTLYFSEKEQQRAVSKIKSSIDNTSAQFWVGFNGRIVQILKDDNSGSRHQKFIVKPTTDISLLVAHNIDLAKRVPIKVGDSISISGRYEWNNRGGVIHWTHHDPKGKKKGGWIKANGKTYR